MKVLQINSVYQRGSTGKLIHDIHNSLSEYGVESIVCYGRGQSINEPYVYKTSSEWLAKFNALRARVTGLQYNGSFFATWKLIKIITDSRPDIVHLHCINGYFVNIYTLLSFLKKECIPTVLTLHAEFMYTGGCGHSIVCEKWNRPLGCSMCPQLQAATKSWFLDRTHTAWHLMKEAFTGFDRIVIVSVSPWLENRARQSPILVGKKHITILNGIDTKNVFYPRTCVQMKRKHGINDARVILHVTADFQSPFKGGKYVIELAKSLKSQNIKIVLVGNNDHSLDLPENIIDVGRVENQSELATYYSMADLTVLTSLRETFSMICAESLACGTPIIGFRAGAPEQISLPEGSEFVEHGNMVALLEAVDRWIDTKDSCKDELAKNAIQFYSKERMYREYLAVYEEIQPWRKG